LRCSATTHTLNVKRATRISHHHHGVRPPRLTDPEPYYTNETSIPEFLFGSYQFKLMAFGVPRNLKKCERIVSKRESLHLEHAEQQKP
jgi:hypothetical protein